MRCLASLVPALVCFLGAAYFFLDPVSPQLRRAGVFEGDPDGDPATASRLERAVLWAGGVVLVLIGGFFLYLATLCYVVL